MRNIVLGLLAVVAGLANVLPATAGTLLTGAQIQSGGGNVPLVKAVWETPDDDTTKPGTQVNPPLSFGGKKTVTYWAVVYDEEDGGKVSQVYVDLHHPAGPPENGSLKYQVPLALASDKLGIGVNAFEAAFKGGMVTFASGVTADAVRTLLSKCTGEVWKGQADLAYHQPAGTYGAEAFAIDFNGNLSAPLASPLEYVAGTGVEIDFTNVNYGSAAISKAKWVGGDADFTTPARPSIRNVGNTNAFVWVKQDDMGMGKDVTGAWNVRFGARLGSNPVNDILYDPGVNTKLPGVLPLCNTDGLDFSIQVKKAISGQKYTGTMWITSNPAPF